MAQDKVQLKREEIVGNDIVLQDINPKTKTNSITDSTKGVPLDQTLSMIKNMINNKLSRDVNSVNGKTGIVILDAKDVGLENVDNISFGDIKTWVIEYMGDIFGSKRIILREYLSEIHEIIGTNDKVYDNTPFYAEKGAEDVSDYMAYIGYIYWDAENERLKEEHFQVKVVGFTDKSLRYNVANTQYANGGLGVNIWKGEDALKVMNNAISYSGYTKEDMDNSGLYIDKTKVVPNVYFFDGVYGELTGSGANMHNQNALVYWTNSGDTSEGELPLLQIQINGTPISMTSTSGGTVSSLHLGTGLDLKFGDIVITNFAYDQYINPDDPTYYGRLYPRMLDSLTCRQPSIGHVIQAADKSINQPCIINFHPCKPNVGHGLKLLATNTYTATPEDKMIGLDLFETRLKMNDGTAIGGDNPTNMSGLNALDSIDLSRRFGSAKSTPKRIYTVYPTGKSNNLLEASDGMITTNSTFIMPNFSLCVIPGYEFTQLTTARPIENWNGTSPMGDDRSSLGDKTWSMLGVNLTKVMFGENHSYARNISGLRVNEDTDTLHESWFGFGDDTGESLYSAHSGGLSVNVGDFLGIGTSEELAKTQYAEKTDYYSEGKVNVRVDRMKGLHNSGDNKLAVNIAQGYTYESVGNTPNWLSGGLEFVNGGSRNPDQGLLGVNTGHNASGLTIENNYFVDSKRIRYNYQDDITRVNNVLAVKPFRFSTNTYDHTISRSGIEVHRQLLEEDIAHMISITNIYNTRMWRNTSSLHDDMVQYPDDFDTDHVYIAEGRHYLFARPDGQVTVTPYFAFYSTQQEYDDVIETMRTGIAPETIWPIPEVSILRRQCHVLILENPNQIGQYTVKACVSKYSNSTSLRYPDFNRDSIVNSIESSAIRALYTDLMTSIPAYSQTVGGVKMFYSDPELTTPLVPEYDVTYQVKNESYVDPENPTHVYYMLYVGTKDPGSDTVYLKKYELAVGVDLTFEDLMSADVNRDGKINAIDSSSILTFYANCATGMYEGASGPDSWKTYIRDTYGIVVADGVVDVYEVLNCIYEKGVRLRYNELKGLTTNSEYIGINESDSINLRNNDIKNSLSIKIADPSSGMAVFDPTKAGGLRFGSEGYLGIRINDNNNFVATTPMKNNMTCIDDMAVGTHGLRIYDGNILGVQLTERGDTDNGELYIDDKGCLRLSGAIRPDVKALIISGEYSDGASAAVSYTGSESLTINLGPGLCFST